ncbi:zinc-ribbon domain-containing protein [Glaciihabitans sp. dw_435]|uniref:zinc-ribbon domain-containing protein n=1 Tax=Glaciihabitans sp. dw_435 TaxID=2720081 RepID=UPI0027DC954D|nr:zinc-ribbon domain-containing protein [Glaciihabitans sp. dw_435]
MPENVDAWWSRRQMSKGTPVPYPVGTYREDWQRYPVLIHQYHPEFNSGITLTQIPPAAEVLLLWQCDVGHLFAATPEEQRNRPGRERRRSSWCPECAAGAINKRMPQVRPDPVEVGVYECGHPRDPRRIDDASESRCYFCRRLDSSPTTRDELLSIVTPGARAELSAENGTARTYRWQCPRGHGTYAASVEKMLGGRRCTVCAHAAAAADRYRVGDAFVSPWAPATASAAEADLRQRLAEQFDFDLTCNAVKVARPFFAHVEVWPDIVIPDLRIAIEYDTIGRHGLEHVGKREDVDRRKDRLLRACDWEVVRLRMGKLEPLGPWDIVAGSVTGALMSRLANQFGEIRGHLMVQAFAR